MIILGIETTCDETGVGIVEDGRKVLANVVSSSVNLYKKYKGVVPEVAAREQVRVIIPVIEEACQVSNVKCQDVDAIAVAYGPGLIGSLLAGVEMAKTLALVWNKPLVPVSHLIGHVYANWLVAEQVSSVSRVSQVPRAIKRKAFDTPTFPLVALIVSGGHTDLILMTEHGKYKWLGGTRDDAAGEAFDKVARLLGLGYPGGPEIERMAREFTVNSRQSTVELPRPMIDSADFDFSFSGLKTAVANLVHGSRLTVDRRAEIAHEFQEAIVDVLVTKTVHAAKKFDAKSIVVGGGVAANELLRSQFSVLSAQSSIPVFFPPKELAVDNGAMIATAAFYNFKPKTVEELQAQPGLYF